MEISINLSLYQSVTRNSRIAEKINSESGLFPEESQFVNERAEPGFELLEPRAEGL